MEQQKKSFIENKFIVNRLTDKPIGFFLCCDGSCIMNGSCGSAQYKISDGEGNVYYESPTFLGTNNLAEFAGIVHGIRICNKLYEGTPIPLYSDSNTALSWLKYYGPANLEKLDYPGRGLIGVNEMFKKLTAYLLEADATKVNIHKWMTHLWGEIPADFGRK
jgi:ribonuclease HI